MLFIPGGVADACAWFPHANCIVSKGRDMKRELKPIPAFRDEAEERRFWETHDSSDYVDWNEAKRVRFPNLKRSASPPATNDDAGKK
jgi:hypothetical protein